MFSNRRFDFLLWTLSQPAHSRATESHALPDGTVMTLGPPGVLTIEPLLPAEGDAVISAGIHGNETAPVELVNRIVSDILQGTLSCKRRTLFILGNPAALVRQQRQVQMNLNRLFNGTHRCGSDGEHHRAAQLEDTLSKFAHEADKGCAHFDLHTAIRRSRHRWFAIRPHVERTREERNMIALLAGCGVEAVVTHRRREDTFSDFTARTFGWGALTVELGTNSAFGENDPADLAPIEGALRTWLHGGSLDGSASPSDSILYYRVARTIVRESEEFMLRLPDRIVNFTPVVPGTLIATDGAVRHTIEDDGQAILFPNDQVPVGHRACLVVEREGIASW